MIPTSDIGDSWLSAGFDDSSWSTGTTGVGYGDDDDNMIVTGNISSIYIRNIFTVSGDNSTTTEVRLFSNRHNVSVNTEDVVSICSVQRVYATEAGIEYPNELVPRDNCKIAKGVRKGNKQVAL
jgi:hypothetical protein